MAYASRRTGASRSSSRKRSPHTANPGGPCAVPGLMLPGLSQWKHGERRCGGRMIIVETLRARWRAAPPSPQAGLRPRAMTPVIALTQLPPAGASCFRHRVAVAPPSPTVHPLRPITPNSFCRPPAWRQSRRHGPRSAADYAGQPIPTQAAAPSNPHRRQAVVRPPRVPSWEAFGRRARSINEKRPRRISAPRRSTLLSPKRRGSTCGRQGGGSQVRS